MTSRMSSRWIVRPSCRVFARAGLVCGVMCLAGFGASAAAAAAEPTAGDAAPAATSEKSVNLPTRWVKGHQQKLEMQIERSVKSTSEAAPMANGTQTINERVGMILRIADVSEKATVFHVFITDLDVKVSVREEEYTFESSSPSKEDAGNLLAEAMRPLVGVTIKIVVNAEGEIVSSIGHMNAIVPGNFGRYAEDLIGPMAVRRDWGPILTMKQGDHAARLGESWETTTESEMKGVGMFKLKTRSTLSALAEEKATVDLEGAYTLDAETNDNGTANYTLRESSTQGRYVWNTDDGIIHEAEASRKTVVDGILFAKPVEIVSDSRLRVYRLEMPKKGESSSESSRAK